MVHYLNVKDFLYRLLDIFNPRVTKLQDLTRIRADDVIVLLVLVRLLKLGGILSELVFSNEVAGNQQVYRIVKRGTAYAVVLIFHLNVERFDVKMTVIIVNLIQYRETLRGFAVAIFLEVGRKNLFYFFL